MKASARVVAGFEILPAFVWATDLKSSTAVQLPSSLQDLRGLLLWPGVDGGAASGAFEKGELTVKVGREDSAVFLVGDCGE